MLALGHLAYSVAFGVATAVLADEGWGVAVAVVGLAMGAFHLGRVLVGGIGRLIAMGWWLPPAALVLVMLDKLGWIG